MEGAEKSGESLEPVCCLKMSLSPVPAPLSKLPAWEEPAPMASPPPPPPAAHPGAGPDGSSRVSSSPVSVTRSPSLAQNNLPFVQWRWGDRGWAGAAAARRGQGSCRRAAPGGKTAQHPTLCWGDAQVPAYSSFPSWSPCISTVLPPCLPHRLLVTLGTWGHELMRDSPRWPAAAPAAACWPPRPCKRAERAVTSAAAPVEERCG